MELQGRARQGPSGRSATAGRRSYRVGPARPRTGGEAAGAPRNRPRAPDLVECRRHGTPLLPRRAVRPRGRAARADRRVGAGGQARRSRAQRRRDAGVRLRAGRTGRRARRAHDTASDLGRQPEGRRRQDDDRVHARRGDGRSRPPGARRRPRRPGEPDVVLRLRPRHPRPDERGPDHRRADRGRGRHPRDRDRGRPPDSGRHQAVPRGRQDPGDVHAGVDPAEQAAPPVRRTTTRCCSTARPISRA